MNSNLPSSAALLSVALAMAITLVLFLYSLGLRAAHILHDKDLVRVRKRWWPVIANAALGINTPIDHGATNLGRASRKKLLREWCRFRCQVKGSSGTSLEILAGSLGLTQVARRLLHRRAISNKLTAIQALGFLRDTRSWDDLETMTMHPNVSISMTAAAALVHINAAKAVDVIVPQIHAHPTWPRTQVGKILNLAGPVAVTKPLCSRIKSAGCDEACRLLQFYESVTMNAMDSLIAELLLTRNEPALIAAALKAVRGQLPKPMIAKFAAHKIWFVRMQAASLLGRFGRREDYGILEPLLSDSEWWVRYRAAQAIVKLPFLGPHALRKLRNRQKDPFAYDILQQALAEAGIE